jgi:P27 family predicted phage terminase small subunit
MTAKLPPELHIVRGTKGMNQGSVLPDSIKKRIPFSEWVDSPDNWDEKRFISETADFLWDTYNIGSDQHRHILQMLADQMTIYIKCKKGIEKNGIVTTFNNGKTVGANPYVSVMKESLNKIVVLMNELGLTPKSQFANKGTTSDTSYTDLLSGVKVKKE